MVCDVLPDLAEEIKSLLSCEGEEKLVRQVSELRIIERCRCGDDFCATVYTASPPRGAWGPGHYTLPLTPKRGFLNVDVLDGEIVKLEVLFRDDIRERLLSLLP